MKALQAPHGAAIDGKTASHLVQSLLEPERSSQRS